MKQLLEQALALRDRYLEQKISLHGLWTATGRLEVKLDHLLAPTQRDASNQRLANHLRHERPYLFTFLYCPGLVDATNNVAEYTAMIRALEEARSLGCERIHVYTDSELMAHQINGKYAVKAAHLVPLFQRARMLMAQFDKATVTHVRRELNRRADALSNLGADQVKK